MREKKNRKTQIRPNKLWRNFFGQRESGEREQWPNTFGGGFYIGNNNNKYCNNQFITFVYYFLNKNALLFK